MPVDYDALEESLKTQVAKQIPRRYAKYLSERERARGNYNRTPDWLEEEPMSEADFGKAEQAGQSRRFLESVKPEREATIRGIDEAERAKSLKEHMLNMQNLKSMQRFQEIQMKNEGRMKQVRATPNYQNAALITRKVIESSNGTYDPKRDPHDNWNMFIASVPKEQRAGLAGQLQNEIKPKKEGKPELKPFQAIKMADSILEDIQRLSNLDFLEEKGITPEAAQATIAQHKQRLMYLTRNGLIPEEYAPAYEKASGAIDTGGMQKKLEPEFNLNMSKPLDIQTAKGYLKKAGGDRQKAMEMAAEEGFSWQ